MKGGGGTPEELPFHITARKGQFVVYKPRATPAAAPAPTHIIEPVATRFTKGVIAFTTSYGNIVVGPTATPQPGRREDRATDGATISALRAFGERAVPAVRDAEVVGTYAGLRPATEHRDYQIVARPADAWITVGGIRSTGLTASPGIAEHVADLCDRLVAGEQGERLPTGSDDEALLVGVTDAAQRPIALAALPPARQPRFCNAPVPTLAELAADYRRRGDGCVELYGRPHRVTHPIASFGMETHNGDMATS